MKPVRLTLETALGIIYHGVFVGLIGMTPGKLLFGIRLRKTDGSEISGADAFGRELLVNIVGYALHVPVLNIFASLIAGLRIERTGVAY